MARREQVGIIKSLFEPLARESHGHDRPLWLTQARLIGRLRIVSAIDQGRSSLRTSFESAVDELLKTKAVLNTLSYAQVAAASTAEGAKARWAEVVTSLAVWERNLATAREELATERKKLAADRSYRLYTALERASWTLSVLTLAFIVVASVAWGAVWLLMVYGLTLVLAAVAASRLRREARKREFRIDALPRRVAANEELLKNAIRHHADVSIRETINAEIVSYDSHFRMLDRHGLEQLSDRTREIPTSASRRLMGLMASLSSGSIGIAGPRGSGKSTLIRSFVDGESVIPVERRRHGVVVSAPVRYDAREFLLHLFLSLCEELLGGKGIKQMQSRLEAKHRAERRRPFILMSGVAGAVLLLLGALVLLANETAPKGPVQTGWLLLGSGLLLLYLLIFMVPGKGSQSDDSRTPEKLAEACIKEIRYQQSVASGSSGSLQLPLGIGLGGSSTTTLTQTPMTFPQVVDRLKRFAHELPEDYYWVIGIDELDKMESEETARRFLNDIKGVFGIAHCYFLVSVSEDAMSSFERRGIPFRDVFDSSFDAIEHAGILTFAEAQDMLERRVVGLPVPFQVLCHSLSGGLPRDLIRAARALAHENRQLANLAEELEASTSTGRSVRALSQAVIGAELNGKIAAALIATRGAVPDESRDWLLSWLRHASAHSLEVDLLREHCRRLVGWRGLASADEQAAPDATTVRSIGLEAAVFTYYSATLLELFSGEMTEAALEYLTGGAVPPVDELVRARHDISLSTRLAWEGISRFRDDLGQAGLLDIGAWDRDVSTRGSIGSAQDATPL